MQKIEESKEESIRMEEAEEGDFDLKIKDKRYISMQKSCDM